MVQTDIIKDIYLISICIWILVWIFAHISVMRFIVPRYEKETGLIGTLYLKKLFPFAKYLPSLWSSIFYYTHLLICLWFWRWIQHSEILSDIKKLEEVTDNFSKKEIWLVHLDLASMIILAIHLSTYSSIFK
jgi:hypothetical protein